MYKGLGAVLTGIVPKMAIRFTSYEWYKQMLADQNGMVSSKSTFMGKCIPTPLPKYDYEMDGLDKILENRTVTDFVQPVLLPVLPRLSSS